ncbi:hypothetical protein NC651_026240 [Populus alba x Populus x berolinensis]|nr:hypothetical protein NC651_026240 [Populus alba x Populus x berolinensis]
MVFFGYGAKGMEAVLALYMRILLFFLLQTLFWIPFTLLLWVAFVLLPSLPLARFLHGAMAVSVHSGMYHRELFPRLVEGSWDGKTRHISTTGMHSSAITDSGDGRLGPGPGQGPNEGGGLSILCKVKAFPNGAGRGGAGLELGSRTTYELSTENFAFVRLETKDGTPAVVMWSHASRIAGGGYHCLALTGKVTPERHDEGQVLSWGFDGHGQLGHSSIQCQKIPAVIDVLADQHVIHVTCGGSSLAAITVSLSLRIGGSGMDTRSKARTLSGPVSDPSKLPKWNHDGSQFYCSAGTNARKHWPSCLYIRTCSSHHRRFWLLQHLVGSLDDQLLPKRETELDYIPIQMPRASNCRIVEEK